ncbi:MULTISPECIES: putative entry exclusion protein TrbK-alt [Brucella]|uniref:putative entry exclusion protein TrbK-alt n=1 Tax=Brucella TaxID=234 RepID=UPI00124C602C|nr:MULTISPECIES: putative entry exclusion protein TrbK-alt [Brucella]KAB2678472.1 putative entry exclusion protein TrbK-alt [Brucella pseudintermedia]KAB2707182.1 putative entry exclusion protein TrbK-alt [Brucella intermedia]
MDMKIAARMIAVFAIGAGLTAAIAALQNDEDRPDADAPRIEHPGGDPSSLSAAKSELTRCRDLGTAALEDVACRKAWAENRRRFFRMDKPDRPTPPKGKRGGRA